MDFLSKVAEWLEVKGFTLDPYISPPEFTLKGMLSFMRLSDLNTE